jgi:tRNA-specific 2-thiouridylase
LKNKLNLNKGNVLDLKGNIIGNHDGAAIYTVGERHGFHVETKDANQEPFYIISKNIVENTLTVGRKIDLKTTNTKEVELKHINLLVEELPEDFEVAFRYQGKKEKVKIKNKNEEGIVIELENEIVSPAAGQSAVFYKNGCCLGGGVIQ